MNNFKQNIKQVDEYFKNVFTNLDITKNFVREFVRSYDLTATSLSSKQIDEINKAVKLLFENAKILATRKEQQTHFLPLFTKMEDKVFIKNFNEDEQFRIMFVQLLIIFLDKNNQHDNDTEHHVHLAKQIKKALSLI